MAKILRKLRITECSLVDAGAAQHAHVLLAKRAAGDEAKTIAAAKAALQLSYQSIMGDDAVIDKVSPIAASRVLFEDHLIGKGVGRGQAEGIADDILAEVLKARKKPAEAA